MYFTIPADHPALPGHFPGQPIVPRVVVLGRVVEVIEAGHGPLPPLRLPQVKFLLPVLPGQAVQVCVEGEAPRWRFRVLRDDSVVASGEVVAESPAAG